MSKVNKIIGFVAGAVPVGTSIVILVGAMNNVEDAVSLLAVGTLFIGIGLIVISANMPDKEA